MSAERVSQDPIETYFCKQHPPGALKDNVALYDFGYVNTFRNQNVFTPIAAGNVKDENSNFASDRTSSISEKIQAQQLLLSSKVSSSYQIPSYQTNATIRSNEYINKYINNGFVGAIADPRMKKPACHRKEIFRKQCRRLEI